MAATAGTVLFLDERRIGRGVSRRAWSPSAAQPNRVMAGLKGVWARLVQLHLRNYEDASKLPPEYWFQGY